MTGRVFYAAVIGFACGVLARSFVHIDGPYIALGALCSVVLFVSYMRSSTTEHGHYVLYSAVLLIACVLGILRMEYASTKEIVSAYETRIGGELSLEGVVAREPDVREDTTHLFVKRDGELLLVVTSRYTQVSYGDRIRFSGELERPTSFETDLGRTFDYPGYLRAQGVNYLMWQADVAVLERGQGNMLFTHLLAFKHAFMEQVESLIEEPQSGLAEGLLLGVKRALGEDLESAFRSTGIIHIVVLSGYNVMLVVVFVLYMLSFILPFRGRLFVGLGAIAAFALMVGLSATVVVLQKCFREIHFYFRYISCQVKSYPTNQQMCDSVHGFI